jgi:hypothetical protein
MRTYKHWLHFDTIRTEHVKKSFSEGSNFQIRRFYPHPAKFGTMIVEVESPDCYNDLDLCVNSGSSYLKRFTHKPVGLGKGISIEQFESVYGTLLPKEGK